MQTSQPSIWLIYRNLKLGLNFIIKFKKNIIFRIYIMYHHCILDEMDLLDRYLVCFLSAPKIDFNAF